MLNLQALMWHRYLYEHRAEAFFLSDIGLYHGKHLVRWLRAVLTSGAIFL